MAGGNLRTRIRVEGADQLVRQLRGKREELIQGIDRDVERTTLEAINEARAAAPHLTGNLKRMIQLIPQESKPLSRTWGGFAEYTRKQEYEHRSKKGFMRRSQWNARRKLRERIESTIRRLGGNI